MFLVKVLIPVLYLVLTIPKYCNTQDAEPTRYSFNHPPLEEDNEYTRSIKDTNIQVENQEKELETKQSESTTQYVPIVKVNTESDVEEVSKIQTLAGKPKKYRKILRNKTPVKSNLQIPVAVIYDNVEGSGIIIPPQSKGAILKNELKEETTSSTTSGILEILAAEDNKNKQSRPELILSTEATPKPKRVKVQRRRKVVKNPIAVEPDSVTVIERTPNENRRRRPINKEANESEKNVQRNQLRSDNVRSLKEQTTIIPSRVQSSTRSTVTQVTTAVPQVNESERNAQINQFRSGIVRSLQQQTTAIPPRVQSSTRATVRQIITDVPPTSPSTSTIRNTVRQSTTFAPTTVTSDVKRRTENGRERLFIQSRIQEDGKSINTFRGREVVPIVESRNIVYSHSGDFHYSYLSGDGTRAFEDSAKDKSSEVVGGFSYKGEDGKDISLTYEAGVNGYQPVGAHLPTPPPIPPAIARALKYLATKSTPAYDTVTESL